MTYSLRLPARCTEHAGSLLGKNAGARTTGNTPSVGRAVATSSTTITSVTGPSVGAEGKDGDAGAEGAPFGWPSDVDEGYVPVGCDGKVEGMLMPGAT
ncbi:hypothetical protein PC128_g6548 [Phytophthora cactorum]|nr:hypothetical protein PC120_g18789 [Phytophthora cactorum]KAG3085027.1 hypothetical protein PC121_g5273 [Phytophthora cactorum]KAG3197808.1 hypothetical protein PC128_g6548 [Phytophthora cactorum]KAG4041445.1 hypothetical protein PC123_g23045 [Phytophthora cactorum]